MTEKIDNYKLHEGQGHIFKRINLRCDRIESLIEELSRKMEDQIDSVKSDINDLLARVE